jgi:hypothetical protein
VGRDRRLADSLHDIASHYDSYGSDDDMPTHISKSSAFHCCSIQDLGHFSSAWCLDIQNCLVLHILLSYSNGAWIRRKAEHVVRSPRRNDYLGGDFLYLYAYHLLHISKLSDGETR